MIKFYLWIFNSVFLHEIRIKISEKDYLDFLKASNVHNLTIEEKDSWNYQLLYNNRKKENEVRENEDQIQTYDIRECLVLFF